MPQRIRHFLKLALFAITVVLIVLLGVLPIGGSYLYIDFMLNRACGNLETPLSARLSNPVGLEAFTLEPESDLVLDAWYQPGTNGAGIIILPGAYGGSNTMYREFEALHQAGYSVITYDTRSCANLPQPTTLGYSETADLSAAIDWMQQRPEVDPARIGVMGFSMGGATAIMGAASDERLKAVVASGNYGDLATDIRRDDRGQPALMERWIRGWVVRFYEWQTGLDVDQLRPVAAISEISQRAVFLIHGSREFENTRARQQYENAGEPKELWIVEGAGHGDYFAVAPDEYLPRIIEFFDKYLGQNP